MPISSIPELPFDKGFWAYTSCCKQVSSYATTDDALDYSNIIPFDDDEVQPGIVWPWPTVKSRFCEAVYPCANQIWG
jgi:hypothetical protein